MNAGNPPADSNRPAGSESSAVPTATHKAAFSAAKNAVIPFGKYKGQTIDTIAQTDAGLGYLDWLRGTNSVRSQVLRDALDVYLTDASIARELQAAIDSGRVRSSCRDSAGRERLNEYGM